MAGDPKQPADEPVAPERSSTPAPADLPKIPTDLPRPTYERMSHLLDLVEKLATSTLRVIAEIEKDRRAKDALFSGMRGLTRTAIAMTAAVILVMALSTFGLIAYSDSIRKEEHKDIWVRQNQLIEAIARVPRDADNAAHQTEILRVVRLVTASSARDRTIIIDQNNEILRRLGGAPLPLLREKKPTPQLPKW